MKSKRGEMTIGAIVGIILAIFVLVFIIYAFTTGTVPFLDTIRNFGGGTVNVQTVVQSCQVACTTQSVYDYCTRTRNVVFDTDKNNQLNNKPYSCLQLQQMTSGGVGLEPCNIDCPVPSAVQGAGGALANGVTP